MNKGRAAAAAALMMLGGAGAPAWAATTLTTGTGDGSVTVTVLDAGGFGSSTDGLGGSDATYDPVGARGQGATTFLSSVFLGFGNGQERTDITQLAATVTASSATSVSSSFAFGGLSFALVQDVARLLDGTVQTGSLLTQAYTITNTGDAALGFDLVRYLDGDLGFEGTQGRLDDGGGRYQAADGTEFLFETDRAIGTAQSDTFVGITNAGGTSTGFDVVPYESLFTSVRAGGALLNRVVGDGADGDQFIDAGDGYDTALALGRLFSLGAGQSVTFTTRTYFGTGAPEDVVTPPPSGAVPEPATWAMLLLGFGVVGAAARTRRRATVRFA